MDPGERRDARKALVGRVFDVPRRDAVPNGTHVEPRVAKGLEERVVRPGRRHDDDLVDALETTLALIVVVEERHGATLDVPKIVVRGELDALPEEAPVQRHGVRETEVDRRVELPAHDLGPAAAIGDQLGDRAADLLAGVVDDDDVLAGRDLAAEDGHGRDDRDVGGGPGPVRLLRACAGSQETTPDPPRGRVQAWRGAEPVDARGGCLVREPAGVCPIPRAWLARGERRTASSACLRRVTWCPRCAATRAASRPAGPPPMTSTRRAGGAIEGAPFTLPPMTGL